MALREKLQTAEDALSEPGRFGLPVGLINIGIAAWLFIGAVIVMLIAGAFIYLSASISIPLILAVVIGTVAYPVAEYLQRRGIGATWAAAIVLVGLAVIIGRDDLGSGGRSRPAVAGDPGHRPKPA